MRKNLFFLAFSLLAGSAAAQTDRQLVRQGNKHFQRGDYEKAEIAYSKAIEKNDKNPQARFNLGNALMAQKKDSAAVEQFQASARTEPNVLRRAQAFHNTGVMCQQHKMYGEAIEAYKQALRLNPHDDETRYNLALCKHEKSKQDQQNRQQDQQQQDNKKDQQQKDQQQQQQQDRQKDQQQQEQQQQQPKPEMSKENAEQLLNAAMQQEKQTQQKLKEAQQQGQRRQNEKNW